MAVRRPLYWDSGLGGLREMSDTQIEEIRLQSYWLYLSNPSVTLEVVTDGTANISGDVPYDTRLQAGAATSSTTGYPGEAGTEEPSVVSVQYYRLKQTTATVSAPTDTNNVRFPVYYDSGNIRAMTLTDMQDTFAVPAVNSYAYNTTSAVYTISTSSSLSGYTLVSSTPVMVDTRADTSAYTFDGIPETLDQPTTISSFYIHKRDSSSQSYTLPVYAQTNGNIAIYSGSTFNSILTDCMRYVASNVVSSRIRYAMSTSTSGGIVNGSGMTDTRLDGSGAYTEYFVNADDYRAQEFPDGSPYTVSTYYLLTQLY